LQGGNAAEKKKEKKESTWLSIHSGAKARRKYIITTSTVFRQKANLAFFTYDYSHGKNLCFAPFETSNFLLKHPHRLLFHAAFPW
jgi:hypothetical protein